MSTAALLFLTQAQRDSVLARIYDKCQEDAGCMRWGGATTGNGVPLVYLLGTAVSARRVVAHLCVRPLKPGERVTVRCECADCMLAGHLVIGTQADVMRVASHAGRLDSPTRAAKARARMVARSRLTDADIAAFRASKGEATLAKRAARWGISPSYGSRLDSGECRAHIGPFAGLGAR